MHVTEIGGQHWQQRIDREAGAIPADEGADREAMSEIVETREAASEAMRTESGAQADLGRYTRKRVFGAVLRNPDPALGEKESVRAPLRDRTIPDLLIARDGCHGGCVQRHESRLAEFGAADAQRRLSTVEIGIVEGDDFRAPESCDGEQSKQRGVGPPTQTFRRRQVSRSREQPRKVFLTIEAGWLSPIAARQQVAARDFGPGHP